MPNSETKVRAAIYTLGCKVNSYESIAISERLSPSFRYVSPVKRSIFV